jgi:hypothetical protein
MFFFYKKCIFLLLVIGTWPLSSSDRVPISQKNAIVFFDPYLMQWMCYFQDKYFFMHEAQVTVP